MALKRFGRDVAVYGGTDLLFRGLQFLVLPVYAFRLSVAEFGVLALVQVSCTLLGMVLNLGVNNAVQRYYYDDTTAERQRSVVVSAGLAQLLVSSVIGVAIVSAVTYAFRSRIEVVYALPWAYLSVALATIVPEQVAQYSLDAARLQFAPLRFVAIAVTKNVLAVLLGLLLLVQFDLGVRGILLGTMTAAFLAAPIGLWMIRSDLRFGFDWSAVKRMLHFGLPFVLAGAAYWIFGSIDRWMLIELSNIEQVGLFSVGLKIAAIPMFAISAFGQAWSPFAYKLAAADDHYRPLFARILTIWFFVLALMALCLSLFSYEIMTLLTPKAYWPAASIFAIAVCGIALYGTTLVTALGVSITKRTMLLSKAAWLAAVVNIVTNLVLIPMYGGFGAAVATLVSYAVLAAALLRWSQKFHPLPLEWGKLAYSCLLLAVALAASAILGGKLSIAGIALKFLVVGLAIFGGFAAGIISPRMYRDVQPRLFSR